jgi:gas vesicle protein
MSGNKNSSSGFFLNFLLGAAAGSILSLLFSPKSGGQFRKDLQEDLNSYLNKVKTAGNSIVEDAKKIADDMVDKANQLLVLTNKWVDGNFNDTIEKIEKEIKSVKNAIYAAVETYNNNNVESENSSGSIADDIFIDFVNENSEDFDEELILPLHEGMKRRQDRKYY